VVAGSLQSSAYPNKSGIKMSMSVELWWNGADRETSKYWEELTPHQKSEGRGAVRLHAVFYIMCLFYVRFPELSSHVPTKRTKDLQF